MKSNRWIVFVAVTGLLCLATGFVVRSSLEADEKKPPADRENPFAGKVIMIFQKQDSLASYNLALEGAAFSEIKGRQFLTGKRVDKSEGAWHGLKSAVALDNIGSIYEFDNVERYRKFEEKAAEEAEAAGMQEVLIPRVLPPVLERDREAE